MSTERDSQTARWVATLAASALDPRLAIDAEISCAGVAFGDVEPAIALWVAPELVETATVLHGLAQDALADIVTACAVRRVALDRAAATHLLEAAFRKWLDARPQLALWVDWSTDANGRLRLRPRRSAFTGAMPERAVVMLRLALEDRLEKRVLPIAALPHLAVAMDWLRGDRPDGLEEALGDPAVAGVLDALERVGALVPAAAARPDRARCDRRADAGRLVLTHMAHAFVMADYGGRRILIDPVLHASERDQEVAPLTARELGRVDAIFFTHHHLDHMQPATLLQLPHDAPVFVPAANGRPLTPRPADFLRLIGFRDVREIRAGDTHAVGGGLVVHAAPFTGEGSGVLHFEGCTYVVDSPAGRALFHADASPGNDGESVVASGALASLVARDGPIDAVFGTWWQDRRFLIALAPLAIFMDDVHADDWLRDVEFCDCPTAFLEALVGTARARLFVTYAEGNEEGFLPLPLVSPATPAASFLWRSRESVCDVVGSATGAATVAAQPFMRVVFCRDAAPVVDAAAVGSSRGGGMNPQRRYFV